MQKRHIFNRGISLSQLFSSTSLFGIFGKFGVKPLLSFILVLTLFISSSLPSFAVSSVIYRLHDFTLADGDPFTVWDVQTVNGKQYTRLGWSSSNGDIRIQAVYKLSSELKVGKNYTLTFDVINQCSPKKNGTNYSTDASLNFIMALSTSTTNFDDAVEIFSFDTSDNISNYSIQFTYPETFTGKQVYLVCIILGLPAQNLGGNLVGSVLQAYVSDFVFVDNNASEEEKIDGILEWLSALYHSIVGGEDNRGVQHDGIVQGIKNGLSELGDKFVNAINNIRNFFVELGENIIDGLKRLFVPEDGFFESKKEELETFLSDHFGILWTAPDIIISTIRQLLTISPEEPSITMPSIQFEWEGETVTLTEPMTVYFNDYIGSGTPLHTFYQFYRTFVSIFLIFLFLHYCINKYHYIFGKQGEAVS